MSDAARSVQTHVHAPIYYYTYVSSAVGPLTSQDLVALLDESRTWNAAWGVTGILLYKGGNFMQLLEGDEANVRLLVSRIARDPRHTAMTPLIDGFEAARHYPDWTMAFTDLDTPEIQSLPGYSSFLTTPLSREVFAGEPWNAYKLLLAFKRYIGGGM